MRIALTGTSDAPDLTVVEGDWAIRIEWALESGVLGGPDRSDRIGQLERATRNDLGAFLALETDATAIGASAADLVRSRSGPELADLVAAGVIAPVADVTFLAPLARGARIFCVGRNYAKRREQEPDQVASFFIRTHDTMVGHDAPLVRPRVSDQLDWEVELAVVIGRPGRYIARDQAMSYVAGFSVLNDGSLRDYARRARYNTASKNFVGSGSFGPWITTKDSVTDPQHLGIRTYLNEELTQSGDTAGMLFSIATLIADVSEFAQLRPGDIISTGSPDKIVTREQADRFLRPGDVVRFVVDEIGELRNFVIDESDGEVQPG